MNGAVHEMVNAHISDNGTKLIQLICLYTLHGDGDKVTIKVSFVEVLRTCYRLEL